MTKAVRAYNSAGAVTVIELGDELFAGDEVDVPLTADTICTATVFAGIVGSLRFEVWATDTPSPIASWLYSLALGETDASSEKAIVKASSRLAQALSLWGHTTRRSPLWVFEVIESTRRAMETFGLGDDSGLGSLLTEAVASACSVLASLPEPFVEEQREWFRDKQAELLSPELVSRLDPGGYAKHRLESFQAMLDAQPHEIDEIRRRVAELGPENALDVPLPDPYLHEALFLGAEEERQGAGDAKVEEEPYVERYEGKVEFYPGVVNPGPWRKTDELPEIVRDRIGDRVVVRLLPRHGALIEAFRAALKAHIAIVEDPGASEVDKLLKDAELEFLRLEVLASGYEMPPDRKERPLHVFKKLHEYAKNPEEPAQAPPPPALPLPWANPFDNNGELNCPVRFHLAADTATAIAIVAEVPLPNDAPPPPFIDVTLSGPLSEHRKEHVRKSQDDPGRVGRVESKGVEGAEEARRGAFERAGDALARSEDSESQDLAWELYVADAAEVKRRLARRREGTSRKRDQEDLDRLLAKIADVDREVLLDDLHVVPTAEYLRGRVSEKLAEQVKLGTKIALQAGRDQVGELRQLARDARHMAAMLGWSRG